jgi:hypothetical protein
METEEFERDVDENDEPIEGSETAIADDPGETDEDTVATPEGTTEVDEDLEDRGDA